MTVKCGLLTSNHCSGGEDEKLEVTANRKTRDANGFNIVEAFLPECFFATSQISIITRV